MATVTLAARLSPCDLCAGVEVFISGGKVSEACVVRVES